MELTVSIKNQWDKIYLNLAEDKTINGQRKMGVLRGIIDGFYARETAPVIFDKNRGWNNPEHLMFLQATLPYPVKLIVPVRDTVGILTSLELEYRRAVATGAPPAAPKDASMATIEDRIKVWASSNGMAGHPANMIKLAVQWGFRDSMFFVEYDRLVNEPEVMMKELYQWLGYDYFEHNFKHVEQTTKEDDRLHGLSSQLHDIKPEVKKSDHDPRKILGYREETRQKRDPQGRPIVNHLGQAEVETVVTPLADLIITDDFWKNL
jgi:sulfotransferase